MERKDFLKYSLGTVGALALKNSLGNSLEVNESVAKRIKDFSIQIYSVRDALAKDVKGTLKLLAEYGYKRIESFGGEKGIFWGLQPQEFKSYISDLGMNIKSAHFGFNAEVEKTIQDAASIGMEYLIYPWEGTTKTIDDYKKMAEDFNKWGKLCKENGIKFAFHNHDYTFELRENQYAQHVLMNNTDADTVFYQMDIYWVVAAGQDPITWIKKYPNRFKLCHIKDREKDAKEKFASCVLGNGTIDFKKILKTAKKNGMEHFVVEQEKYAEGTSMECAKMNAAYMKKLKI